MKRDGDELQDFFNDTWSYASIVFQGHIGLLNRRELPFVLSLDIYERHAVAIRIAEQPQ